MKTKKDNISRKDWKYMEQQPYGDPGFSVEYNQRVIAEVNAWNEAMDRTRNREQKSDIAERTSAVAQYLKNLGQGKGVQDVNTYFGRRHLAYLRGEEIVKKLQANPALVEKLKHKMEQQGKLQPL